MAQSVTGTADDLQLGGSMCLCQHSRIRCWNNFIVIAVHQ
jgi:hypothetical protein